MRKPVALGIVREKIQHSTLESLHLATLRHFIRGQHYKRPTSYLFNKVVLEIDKANDQVIMTTFQAGLNNPDLIFSLGKMPPTSMTDLLFKAQKYMNGRTPLRPKG